MKTISNNIVNSDVLFQRIEELMDEIITTKKEKQLLNIRLREIMQEHKQGMFTAEEDTKNVSGFMTNAHKQKDLCKFYNISAKTFRKWLRPYQDRVGPKNGQYYSPQQVEIIFDILGVPEEVGFEID